MYAHFSSISRYVHLTYSAASEVCMGSDSISSTAGVQQGDPLGSMLFCAGLHAFLLSQHVSVPPPLWSRWYVARRVSQIGRLAQTITNFPKNPLELEIALRNGWKVEPIQT
eukprot:Plantae.Rhodophyta-Rhodochaete_pulchella.ctg16224.p1 GENE.Plantae.Rhodophyta-Rhodochaete_pulchella.ctg16224~~Plantae.Rhodophyta-Rhodochaete_pulchella.ctg16224.p1  ORF type:complete len:111 (-),score=5.16 Plantae.Rhodophyta-Rhodochaete_pulchella.ctg16224:751-1083(-)